MAAIDTLWQASASPGFQRHQGDAVTLRSGTRETEGITAQAFIAGAVSTDGPADYPDALTHYIGCDWIISRADYQLDGEQISPQAGQVLIDADGDEWEVLPQDKDTESSLQPGKSEWLVRTKKVSSA